MAPVTGIFTWVAELSVPGGESPDQTIPAPVSEMTSLLSHLPAVLDESRIPADDSLCSPVMKPNTSTRPTLRRKEGGQEKQESTKFNSDKYKLKMAATPSNHNKENDVTISRTPRRRMSQFPTRRKREE